MQQLHRIRIGSLAHQGQLGPGSQRVSPAMRNRVTKTTTLNLQMRGTHQSAFLSKEDKSTVNAELGKCDRNARATSRDIDAVYGRSGSWAASKERTMQNASSLADHVTARGQPFSRQNENSVIDEGSPRANVGHLSQVAELMLQHEPVEERLAAHQKRLDHINVACSAKQPSQVGTERSNPGKVAKTGGGRESADAASPVTFVQFRMSSKFRSTKSKGDAQKVRVDGKSECQTGHQQWRGLPSSGSNLPPLAVLSDSVTFQARADREKPSSTTTKGQLRATVGAEQRSFIVGMREICAGRKSQGTTEVGPQSEMKQYDINDESPSVSKTPYMSTKRSSQKRQSQVLPPVNASVTPTASAGGDKTPSLPLMKAESQKGSLTQQSVKMPVKGDAQDSGEKCLFRGASFTDELRRLSPRHNQFIVDLLANSGQASAASLVQRDDEAFRQRQYEVTTAKKSRAFLNHMYSVQKNFLKSSQEQLGTPTTLLKNYRESSIERIIAYQYEHGLKDPRTALKTHGSRNKNVVAYRTPLGGKVLGISVKSSETGENYPSVFVPVGASARGKDSGAVFAGSRVVEDRLARGGGVGLVQLLNQSIPLFGSDRAEGRKLEHRLINRGRSLRGGYHKYIQSMQEMSLKNCIRSYRAGLESLDRSPSKHGVVQLMRSYQSSLLDDSETSYSEPGGSAEGATSKSRSNLVNVANSASKLESTLYRSNNLKETCKKKEALDEVQIRIEQGNTSNATVTLNMETPIATQRATSRPEGSSSKDAGTNLVLEGFDRQKAMAATVRESVAERDGDDSTPGIVSSMKCGGSTQRMQEGTADAQDREKRSLHVSNESQMLKELALTKSSIGVKDPASRNLGPGGPSPTGGSGARQQVERNVSLIDTRTRPPEFTPISNNAQSLRNLMPHGRDEGTRGENREKRPTDEHGSGRPTDNVAAEVSQLTLTLNTDASKQVLAARDISIASRGGRSGNGANKAVQENGSGRLSRIGSLYTLEKQQQQSLERSLTRHLQVQASEVSMNRAPVYQRHKLSSPRLQSMKISAAVKQGSESNEIQNESQRVQVQLDGTPMRTQSSIDERTAILDKERASIVDCKVEDVRHLLRLGDEDEMMRVDQTNRVPPDYTNMPADQVSIMLLHQLRVNELKLEQLRQIAVQEYRHLPSGAKHNFDLIEDEVLTASRSMQIINASKEAASGVMADSQSIDDVNRSIDSLQAVQHLLAQNQSILQALQTQAEATNEKIGQNDFNIKVDVVSPKRTPITSKNCSTQHLFDPPPILQDAALSNSISKLDENTQRMIQESHAQYSSARLMGGSKTFLVGPWSPFQTKGGGPKQSPHSVLSRQTKDTSCGPFNKKKTAETRKASGKRMHVRGQSSLLHQVDLSDAEVVTSMHQGSASGKHTVGVGTVAHTPTGIEQTYKLASDEVVAPIRKGLKGCPTNRNHQLKQHAFRKKFQKYLMQHEEDPQQPMISPLSIQSGVVNLVAPDHFCEERRAQLAMRNRNSNMQRHVRHQSVIERRTTLSESMDVEIPVPNDAAMQISEPTADLMQTRLSMKMGRNNYDGIVTPNMTGAFQLLNKTTSVGVHEIELDGSSTRMLPGEVPDELTDPEVLRVSHVSAALWTKTNRRKVQPSRAATQLKELEKKARLPNIVNLTGEQPQLSFDLS